MATATYDDSDARFADGFGASIHRPICDSHTVLDEWYADEPTPAVVDISTLAVSTHISCLAQAPPVPNVIFSEIHYKVSTTLSSYNRTLPTTHISYFKQMSSLTHSTRLHIWDLF